MLVHLNLLGSVEGQSDLRGIGAGRHDEVVFELALIAVVDQINPGIDVCVGDLLVRRNVRAPLRRISPDDVIDDARKLVEPDHLSLRIGALEGHPDHRVRGWRWAAGRRALMDFPLSSRSLGLPGLQCQYRVARGQEERVPAPMCEELYGRIPLALIGFEAERQMPIGGLHDGHRRRWWRSSRHRVRPQRGRRRQTQGNGERDAPQNCNRVSLGFHGNLSPCVSCVGETLGPEDVE